MIHAVILLILILRLLTLGMPGIIDPSEARFALGAQRMLETGDWVMPTIFEQGQWMPFWSKPPLQYWLIAISYKMFGMNAWAARLPSYVALVLLLVLMYSFGRRFVSAQLGISAVFVLMTCIGFFYFSVGCLSDLTLALCIAGIVYTTALFTKYPTKHNIALVISGLLGVGMLIKGPVALIYAAAILAPWLLFNRRWKLFATIQWKTCALTFLIVALPWYLVAELYSPGFNKYFFVYENFLRYFRSDYPLRYGTLHKTTYGMIWVMLAGILLPWLLLLIKIPWKQWRSFPWKNVFRFGEPDENDYSRLVMWWALGPTLFLTFSSNLHATYIFPTLPAYAFLIAMGMEKFCTPELKNRFVHWSSWGAVVCTLILFLAAPFITERRSTAAVFDYLSKEPHLIGQPVSFVLNNPLSAYFYGHSGEFGQWEVKTGILEEEFQKAPPELFAIKSGDIKKLPEALIQQFDIRSEQGVWVILQKKSEVLN